MTSRDPDSKNKAIAELKKMIRRQKARLSPEALKAAEKAVAAKETVPYDKKAATKAIEFFLKNHTDAKTFSKKLLEEMNKKKDW